MAASHHAKLAIGSRVPLSPITSTIFVLQRRSCRGGHELRRLLVLLAAMVHRHRVDQYEHSRGLGFLARRCLRRQGVTIVATGDGHGHPQPRI